MTGMIYELILVSCLTINNGFGDFVSKNCNGQREAYYTNMEKCQVAGQAAIGRIVFRDSVIIGSSEKIEAHKCIGIQVQ